MSSRVFMYGAYMSPGVLAEHGVHVDRWETAAAPGHRLQIGARATLQPDPSATTWGVNVMLRPAEIDQLYADPATLGGILYVPVPIATRTAQGIHRPSTVYIAPDLGDTAAPEPDYVRILAAAARAHALPADHVAHIESFLRG